MHSDSFWGHSLYRMVPPLRHIARTMGVENIGHLRFRHAHFLDPPRALPQKPIRQEEESTHLDEVLWREVYPSDFVHVLNMYVIKFLYLIARIVLFVLPFMELRALPNGEYVQLNWVSFLPHI